MVVKSEDPAEAEANATIFPSAAKNGFVSAIIDPIYSVPDSGPLPLLPKLYLTILEHNVLTIDRKTIRCFFWKEADKLLNAHKFLFV